MVYLVQQLHFIKVEAGTKEIKWLSKVTEPVAEMGQGLGP